jgi:myo-inositol-1(or 4)-monophosphatase
MGEARAIRRDGSAAVDLSYVAAGRVDGFWEEKLHPWDMAAGILMIEEAGGRVSRFDGTPVGLVEDEIVATNGRIHERMLAVLQPDVAR